ncbi:MAG: DNA alkylation repair protein [Zoogloeaceae bacterium]|jgi:3-methyladenine DNA glycosylase AlkC|nr:DNA alkylation repair protein [Zoogloeaceae bacterium]
MAKKIRDDYGDDYARMLAGKIKALSPDFQAARFFAALAAESFTTRPFLARMDVFARALEQSLSGDYAARIALFHKLLGDELATETGMFTVGGWLWPLARYVERHGVEDFAVSVGFIRELTKRHTGEFAVRPLLRRFPDAMLAVMQTWSRDDNVHVRRLASEGLRPRLPWAKKLPLALEHFAEYKAILTNLKDDPSRFVQKSVGNNLNDLFKDAPDKAREIITEWRREELSKAAQWIIRHGTRRLKPDLD